VQVVELSTPGPVGSGKRARVKVDPPVGRVSVN